MIFVPSAGAKGLEPLILFLMFWRRRAKRQVRQITYFIQYSRLLKRPRVPQRLCISQCICASGKDEAANILVCHIGLRRSQGRKFQKPCFFLNVSRAVGKGEGANNLVLHNIFCLFARGETAKKTPCILQCIRASDRKAGDKNTW